MSDQGGGRKETKHQGRVLYPPLGQTGDQDDPKKQVEADKPTIKAAERSTMENKPPAKMAERSAMENKPPAADVTSSTDTKWKFPFIFGQDANVEKPSSEQMPKKDQPQAAQAEKVPAESGQIVGRSKVDYEGGIQSKPEKEVKDEPTNVTKKPDASKSYAVPQPTKGDNADPKRTVQAPVSSTRDDSKKITGAGIFNDNDVSKKQTAPPSKTGKEAIKTPEVVNPQQPPSSAYSFENQPITSSPPSTKSKSPPMIIKSPFEVAGAGDVEAQSPEQEAKRLKEAEQTTKFFRILVYLVIGALVVGLLMIFVLGAPSFSIQ